MIAIMNTLKVIINQRRIQPACYGLVLLIFYGFSCGVAAHFEHPLARVIHVVEEGHGLLVYTRMPLALLLLPESWQGVDAGQHLDHVNTIKEGRDWRYYLDKTAIDENPAVLGREIARSIQLRRESDGVKETTGKFEQLVIHAYEDRPPFNTLEKAKRVFDSGNVTESSEATTPLGYSKYDVESNEKDLEIFDAVVDVKYFIPGRNLRSLHSLESQLGAHLPIVDQVLNIVLLHFAEGTVTLTSQGLLIQGSFQ